MVTFKLPKLDVDAAVVLNTPINGIDNLLSRGVLTIKDESGANALILKASDWLNFKYSAYTTGTANVVDVDLTGVTIVNNGVYSLTVYAPYVQNFFGGGQESGAVYQTRTYTVSLDATATVTELQTAFVSRINADINAYFTATAQAGDVVRITANDPGFGPLTINAPAGATVADFVSWVAPVGSVDEVLQYVPDASLVTGTYNRFIITYRKFIRHNIVNGLQVVKPVQVLVYTNSTNGGTAAFDAATINILQGTDSPNRYLGCPLV